jgi:hypothetical protein
VYDAVFRHNAEHPRADGSEPMPLVVPANEQGAGFMAAGYSRASGRVGVAADVLMHGPDAGHATADFVLAAHQRARPFRCHQHHVDILARIDLLEVHVEAVREQERRAGLDVRLDRLPVQRRLHHVRRQHGDQVGTLHGFGRLGHLEAVGFRLVPGRSVRAQADHDVEAGIAQVQRVRAALAAVAEHGDAGLGEGVVAAHAVTPWLDSVWMCLGVETAE